MIGEDTYNAGPLVFCEFSSDLVFVSLYHNLKVISPDSIAENSAVEFWRAKSKIYFGSVLRVLPSLLLVGASPASTAG